MSMIGSIISRSVAGATSVFLGGQILNNVRQGPEAFTGRFNLAMMYASSAALAYTSGYTLSNEEESNQSLLSTLAVAGGFFATLRYAHTLYTGGEKQFETLFGRSIETLGALGSAFVAVRVGTAVGITPRDVLDFVTTGISFAAGLAYKSIFGGS